MVAATSKRVSKRTTIISGEPFLIGNRLLMRICLDSPE